MSRKRNQATVQAESERRLNEALDKPVNLAGVGEDPAVKALIEKFAKADPVEAMNILSALQRHIQGASDEDDPKKKEKILFLKAKSSEAEAAEKAWNEDRVKFVQEIFDKNPPATGKNAEKIKARAAKKYQQAIQNQQAMLNERRLRLKHKIEHGPKEKILVTGHFEVVGGQMMLLPDEVRLMDYVFILHPGEREVPSVIADAYRNILNLRAERDARRAAMSASDGAGPEFNEFLRRQKVIDKEYGNSEFTGGLVT